MYSKKNHSSQPIMANFSNTIKLITLVWLANILSTGYCKAENSELDCILTPPENEQGESKKITAVNKCPAGYENKDVIDACEFFINRNERIDTELYQPGISNITNKAYWNKYCAICNNDTIPTFPPTAETFYYWNSYYSSFYENKACYNLEGRLYKSEVNDIYNLTQIFIRNGSKLIAERYRNTQLECSLSGKWPLQLIFHIIPCLYSDLYNGISVRLKKCQYVEKTGKICTNMGLLYETLGFQFQDKKEINSSNRLPEYKNFTPGQYYQETEYPGIFYICDIPGTIYGERSWVKISIVVISLIFISINLGINSNKRYFQQNNTNKLLYLYMVGLVPITIILLLIYLSHPVPCIAYYLAKFFWAYHFFWSLLIFIEFCLMAFGALQNNISKIRYLVYLVFGFVIPFAMPIIYYFGILIVNENYTEDLTNLPHSYAQIDLLEYTCPIIPDHFGVFCTASRNFGSKYYEDWLKIFLSPSFYFFIPALFLFASVTSLCYFLNHRSDDAQSSPYKDHLIVITKMTLIMGVHWILFKVYPEDGNDYSSGILGVSFNTLGQLSIDFHGVIVFMVFGAETCIGFIMKIFGCEYKSVCQKDDDMEMS